MDELIESRMGLRWRVGERVVRIGAAARFMCGWRQNSQHTTSTSTRRWCWTRGADNGLVYARGRKAAFRDDEYKYYYTIGLAMRSEHVVLLWRAGGQGSADSIDLMPRYKPPRHTAQKRSAHFRGVVPGLQLEETAESFR
jgi:hypothetical protein